MPRRIDYADRVEAVREAAYEIALQQGPDAIGVPEVAERLCMSERTILRLIASERALPLLAVQRADRLERNRLFRRSSYSEWMSRPAPQRALATLREQLPSDDKSEDRWVWWSLVLMHARTDWARAARAEREDLIAALAAETMTDVTDDAARAREVAHLHFLVSGAIAQICRGSATHAQADDIISRHVRDVLARHAAHDHDAA